jgi:hypothetical protein
MNSIHDICKRYNIKNYIINGDGSIDVNGDVDLWYKGLTELPLRFNSVSGNFDCGRNDLTQLKDCPRWVGGNFYYGYNRLTSLEFSPDYVGGYFFCSHNDLVDNYCNTEIGGRFYTTLKQDGLTINNNIATNYNEWRKMYKRKLILNELYKL